MLQSAINWFEIPVSDFDRARAFYEAIYAIQMPVNTMGGVTMGFFPHEPGNGIGGAIVDRGGNSPSADGARVYLNAGPDLSPVLERVTAAGGKVILPKTCITPEIGYFAVLEDTEGNHVAIHSSA